MTRPARLEASNPLDIREAPLKEYPLPVRNKIRCCVTAPIAPMVNVHPVTISQKLLLRMARATVIDSRLLEAGSLAVSGGRIPSARRFKSQGLERVIHCETGKSTIRMSAPIILKAFRQPKLSMSPLISRGETAPPTPKPRYAMPIARPRLKWNQLETKTWFGIGPVST